jgi:hypothetical protein
LLPREYESTIASAENAGNEKNGHMQTPVSADTSGALEKRENCHKFISNGTVNMVGKMSGEGL